MSDPSNMPRSNSNLILKSGLYVWVEDELFEINIIIHYYI